MSDTTAGDKKYSGRPARLYREHLKGLLKDKSKRGSVADLEVDVGDGDGGGDARSNRNVDDFFEDAFEGPWFLGFFFLGGGGIWAGLALVACMPW